MSLKKQLKTLVFKHAFNQTRVFIPSTPCPTAPTGEPAHGPIVVWMYSRYSYKMYGDTVRVYCMLWYLSSV